jgi:hypothetical protein
LAKALLALASVFCLRFVWCVSAAMESITDDNVKRASAWRVKYMKKDNMQILPSFLGFHPRNRDGLGPNPERCEQLFLELLGQFDKVEANHDAVCVEKKPGCDSFFQFKIILSLKVKLIY